MTDNAVIILALLPLINLISLGAFIFLYGRDIELIIKNAFKKALKEAYREAGHDE